VPLTAEALRRPAMAAPAPPRLPTPTELLTAVGRGPRSLAASLGQLGEAAFGAIAGGSAPVSAMIALAEPVSRPVSEQAASRQPALGRWLGGAPPLPAALFFLLLAAGAVAVWVALRRQLGLPLVSKRWRH
jgi:hypothetical protein